MENTMMKIVLTTRATLVLPIYYAAAFSQAGFTAAAIKAGKVKSWAANIAMDDMMKKASKKRRPVHA